VKCEVCGEETHTNTIPLCPDCARKDISINYLSSIHPDVDKIGRSAGIRCGLCSNRCGIEEGEVSLCNLRRVENGGLISASTSNLAVLQAYEDPLPTNCCNAWFCKASRMRGTNLAVFYYGCSFDCLYCQNWQHKVIDWGKVVSVEDIVKKAIVERVKCICHFGGSPEPQLPFAIKFSREVLKLKNLMICWEWNGSSSRLALKAAELSSESSGTVKFDLKAWNKNLHRILTGRDNDQTLKNFEKIWNKYPDVLSATTLLVPFFVDEKEVEGIARFISSFSDEIPYSLLVFHPDYRLSDMPVTPKKQVVRCYSTAKKYLRNVNVGNIHLIGNIKF